MATKTFSSWSDVKAITNLDIKILHHEQHKKAEIYGNSLNQVGLVMTFKAWDQEDADPTNGANVILIPAEKIWDVAALCDSQTEELLPKLLPDINSFFYTNKENPYSNPVSTSNMRTTVVGRAGETSLVILYVACSDKLNPLSMDISAGLMLDGTLISTSLHNSSSQQHVAVNITGKNKINYSQPDSISIVNPFPGDISHSTSLGTDFRVSYTEAGVAHHDYNGWGNYHICTVSSRAGHRFVSKINKGQTVSNKYMDVISSNDENNLTGYADIIWGDGGNNYDITLLFMNAKHFGLRKTLSGGIPAESKFRYYYFEYTNGNGGDRLHIIDNSHDDSSLNIGMLNMRIPHSELWKTGWEDSKNNSSVDVIDEFGNSGEIRIIYEDSHFLQPSINGARP